MPSYALLPRLFRFAGVGIVVAGVFMGLNWVLDPVVGKQAAFLLAYPPALVVHFSLNRWWTFAYREKVTGRQVGEYLAMVAITFLLQWLVFAALARWTRLPGWIEAGVANVAQTAISFLFMQIRIFGRRSSP